MSTLNKLFNNKAVIIELKATTKEEALKEISNTLKTNGFINDEKNFLEALKNREKQFSTGIGDGIGIPHAQTDVVLKDVVLVAKSSKGIEWKSLDKKPVHTIFSIALNSKNAKKQVEVLADLSKMMIDKSVAKKILETKTSQELFKLVSTYEVQKEKVSDISGAKKIVAVTACPTGIAHTYMAAEYLETAGKELKLNIKVETQGRQTENSLTKDEIDKADLIILAIDKGIDDMGRFNGKNVIKVGTKAVIKDAKKIINDGLSGKGLEKISAVESTSQSNSELEWAAFKNVYKNLMGGVSRMLPFVVGGGILIGLAFLLDSGITGGNLGVTRNISRWFAGLGKVAFGIFIPILGGFVAYSIVGSEGLLPGFVAGIIASGGGLLYGSIPMPDKTTGSINLWQDVWGSLTPGIDQGVLSAGSGFIGAMVGGYIAALSIIILRKYIFAKVGKNFRGIVSIIAVPIFSLLMTGAMMFMLQIPLAYVAYGLKLGLTSLADHNLVWLSGIIVGFMMALDMGGPVNKAAYVFAAGSLGAGAQQTNFIIMAEVMIAGMVPPMAIAFSTLLFRDKAWSKTDQVAAYPNWLLGMFFITEGAIPFAAKDPKHVIPSIIVGSMVSGLMIGLGKVGVNAPHGGIFVFALFKSYLFTTGATQIGMAILIAFIALAAGTVSGGLILGVWRAYDVKKGKLKLI